MRMIFLMNNLPNISFFGKQEIGRSGGLSELPRLWLVHALAKSTACSDEGWRPDEG